MLLSYLAIICTHVKKVQVTLSVELVHIPLRTFNIATVCSFDPLFNKDTTLGNSPAGKTQDQNVN